MKSTSAPAGLEVDPAGLEVAEPQFWAEPTTSGSYGEQKDNSHANQAILTSEASPRKSGSICGLLPASFSLSAALILVIIIAGVSSGVGGTIAVNNAKKAQSNSQVTSTTTFTVTATPTSQSATGSSAATSSSTIPVPTTGSTSFLPLDYPSITNSHQTIILGTKSWSFLITCGADAPGPDIVAVISYSLHDCSQACASYNLNAGQNSCKGATFNAQLAGSVARNYGTCFLKNGSASTSLSTNNGYAGLKLDSSS